MTGAWNKSLPDAPQIPEDPGHSAFSSCSYDTASPLHFHGLADTQTQTQVASSAEATGQGGTVAESRVCIYLIFDHTPLFSLLNPVPVDNY